MAEHNVKAVIYEWQVFAHARQQVCDAALATFDHALHLDIQPHDVLGEATNTAHIHADSTAIHQHTLPGQGRSGVEHRQAAFLPGAPDE